MTASTEFREKSAVYYDRYALSVQKSEVVILSRVLMARAVRVR